MLLEAQNSNIDSKCISRKQNFSPDVMFATLDITPRGHICLTEAVILSSTSNFFVTIALLCNNIMTSKQKFNNVSIFLSASFILTDPSKNTGFVQRVQNVMSVCLLLQLVDFNPCCLPVFQFWLTTNFLAMHCYFPVIRLVNFVRVTPVIVVVP